VVVLVLGIESTCDETSFALVKDGSTILSNVISSQSDMHACYGGVVPELASRSHVEALYPLLNQALQEAQVSLDQVDLIAVANGPGLVGALLVGMNFARGLSYTTGIPLVGVNHIEAHLFAAVMSSNKEIVFPALGAVLSGGHTSLVLVRSIGDYQLIAETVDDAIGECFDKVASMIGLPYPGGPAIERLAASGNPSRFSLKAGRVKDKPLYFSFSGLKTNALYIAKGQNSDKHAPLVIQEEDKKDLAASFQHVALNDVIDKIVRAAALHGCQSILVGGGVSNNQALRHGLSERAPCPVFWPSRGLTMDNAAMIAGLGGVSYQKNPRNEVLSIQTHTRIPF